MVNLFQHVENISVYDLEASFAKIKLQTSCGLTKTLGFHWVWPDPCRIDKKDNVLLQESPVAMFTWYRGSSLTISYLRGVWSHSQRPDDPCQSIWNTRAWTYQEYVAAEVVQFYSEDWWPHIVDLRPQGHCRHSGDATTRRSFHTGADSPSSWSRQGARKALPSFETPNDARRRHGILTLRHLQCFYPSYMW